MYKSIFFGLSALATLAAAQNPLFFTTTPNSVQAGQQYTIGYSTPNPNGDVTITLRDNTNTPGNLGTNKVLTTSARGGSYTWNVPSSLPNGNYALAIDQDGFKENYSGIFSLSGGGSGSMMSSAMPSSMASSMTSMTSMASSMASSMTSSTPLGTPSVMSRISGVAPAGTGSPYGGGMARNSSYVSPTVPTQTSGSGSGSGSSGGSGAAATTTASTGGAASLGSSMALVIGAVAAFAFLN